jgi:hypothetical protein
MAKRAVTQRSFLLGETREDFLEADDLEVRGASCKRALNVRVAATRSMWARPGTMLRQTLGAATDLYELRPTTDLVFGLIINDTSMQIIDEDGSIVQTLASPGWTSGADVWVEPFREQTVLGGSWGLSTLTYTAGVWSVAPFAFEAAAGGDLAQPYWSFRGDLTIQPSAVSGAITLTASGSLWTPAYVGLRVRYGLREILITGYTSPTVVSGTVVSRLPPSYRLTLSATTNFRVGDAVIGQDTDFQGVIIAISGSDIDVATTAFFEGPDISEKISGPSGTATVSAKTTIAPLMSPIWDEPLISPVRGYPSSGASAAGRLTFVDFPLVPDLVCMSSVRAITDFQVGSEDDDAIVRQCGDNAPRFRHAVGAADLLLFSDRGLYYIKISDGGLLTPASFNVILFDKRSANSVRPASVDDGVVFVEASGESIAVCLLDGNIYLKWSVRTISTFHNHLIRTPSKLCGPSIFSRDAEKYLFAVNADGTVAALSWFSDFQVESVGFVPWETEGRFKSISPIFGGYWAIVDRDVGAGTSRFLEEFDDTALVDCASSVASDSVLQVNGEDLLVNGEQLIVSLANQLSLASTEVHVTANGYYLGPFDVDADGGIAESGDFPSGSVAGLNFQSVVGPWPVELVESERAGMLRARVIRGSVSVISSGPFAIRANNNTSRKGGYAFGDDLGEPAPLRTQVYRFMVIGQRDHPEIEVIKEIPAAFKVLAITQEVTY